LIGAAESQRRVYGAAAGGSGPALESSSGGTGFPACVKEAGYSCTAWKGCATSQYQSFHALGVWIEGLERTTLKMGPHYSTGREVQEAEHFFVDLARICAYV
jgi:hypothetical protein